MSQCDINVTSGIRQGCDAPSNCFLLIQARVQGGPRGLPPPLKIKKQKKGFQILGHPPLRIPGNAPVITYCITEQLYDNLSGVNTNICKIVALFFADDGMILMQSLRETKESIQVLMNIAEECGMNINKAKRNIMIFNHKEN